VSSLDRRIPLPLVLPLLGLPLALLITTVPGLHFDEAWLLAEAQRIAEGARPVNAQTNYIGALFAYLMAGVGSLTGFSVASMRLTALALNLGAAGALLWAATPLLRSRRAVLLLGLLLIGSPTFACFARIGFEVTALNPLLTVLGFALAARGETTGRVLRIACWAAGGLCLGLALYNHMQELFVLVAAGLAATITWRRRWLLSARCWIVVAGVLVGASPRLAAVASGVDLPFWLDFVGLSPAEHGHGTEATPLPYGRVGELLMIPWMLRGVVDGPLLYRRFTGTLLIPALPLLSGAFVALLMARWIRTRRLLPTPGPALFLTLTTVFYLALQGLTGWQPSMRQLLLPSLLVPLAIVALARPFLLHEQARSRRLCLGGLLLVAGGNAALVATDLFVSHHQTGGRVAAVELGTGWAETSAHFVRFDRLQRQLVEAGVTTVVAELTVLRPLEHHGGPDAGLVLVQAPRGDEPNSLGDPDRSTVLVHYAGPYPLRTHMDSVQDLRDTDELLWFGYRFERQDGFDPNFLVYRRAPPP